MQRIKEPFVIRGIFEMLVKQNGIIIERYCDDNLIVNGARNQAARLFAGDGIHRTIAKIAFGTNGTDPIVSDTAITRQTGYCTPTKTTVWQLWSLGFYR